MRQKKRCPLAEDILKNFPGDSVFLYPNLGKTSHLTKAAPIIHGMAFIPAPQPDCKLTYLSDKQFAKVLDFLNQPAPTDVQ